MSCHYESKIDTKDLREQNLDDRSTFFHRVHIVLQIKKVQLLLLGLHHDDTLLFEKPEHALPKYLVFQLRLP